MTCDMWHVTHDTWQVGEDEPSLKISVTNVFVEQPGYNGSAKHDSFRDTKMFSQNNIFI